jgi:hypothetical protein
MDFYHAGTLLPLTNEALEQRALSTYLPVCNKQFASCKVEDSSVLRFRYCMGASGAAACGWPCMPLPLWERALVCCLQAARFMRTRACCASGTIMWEPEVLLDVGGHACTRHRGSEL